MEIRVICMGKTIEKYLDEGIENYSRRLKHYVKFSLVIVPHPKLKGDLSWDDIKNAESDLFKKVLGHEPYILLDEKGKEFTSISFARFIQDEFNRGGKRLNFVIGGAFGFSKDMYEGATSQIALSQLTFSHQLVRLVALEQLYRAMSILKGEKYHH